VSAGFSRFLRSNNTTCWFLPDGFQPGNRVRYADHRGTERVRTLVGQSPRRAVYWHFAIEARPSIAGQEVRLIPHVVFSEDGRTPLPSEDRQHTLRRGFCRNWWNARWRDLLCATLSYLARGAEIIDLPVANKSRVTVSGRMSVHLMQPFNDKAESARRQVFSLDEPRVALGYEQTSDDPKEGLLLFGPVSFERNPEVIRTGVIGTKEGIELFRNWSRHFNSFLSDPAGHIPFPGFEAVFRAKWNPDPIHTIAISRTDLINTVRLQDRHHALFRTSSLFVERIEKAVREDDVDVDIWYVVIPDEVYLYGRPASRVPKAIAIATPSAMGRRAARRFSESAPSLFPEDNREAIIYNHHLDFHHQLKARLLGVQAVTQILRESSLRSLTGPNIYADELRSSAESHALGLAESEAAIPDQTLADPIVTNSSALGQEEVDGSSPDRASDDPSLTLEELYGSHSLPAEAVSNWTPIRQMQDPASVAWNLATATFFKSGGRPWRVAGAREHVCYIGLIFKRDATVGGRHACCGAQMFLQDSDGVVFKGAMGPWYSPVTGQFHLSRSEARRLIGKVLQSYQEENKVLPREVFIHGRTRFNNEEWVGFCEAIDHKSTALVGVRITRSSEFKLFSGGEFAVRRGTAIRINHKIGLLWTSGFVPKLGTYPGRETPNPLRVEICQESQSSSDIELIMSDIMMLTKLNFNSCIYADGMPVTMRFADAIGDVLVTIKGKEVPPLPFRHYI
jgi:hypothetical protein